MERETERDASLPVFRVRMFGCMTVEYKEHPIGFSRSGGTKAQQLLALLLMGGREGITKSELIGCLYNAEDGLNLNRNLNNVIYRLKKQLLAAGLPKEEYIVLKGGRCYFSGSFPIEVDALEFKQRVLNTGEGTETEKMRRLQDALLMYTGELFPEFAAELWAIHKRQEYKNLYSQAVTRVGEGLRQVGDLQGEREVYRRAARLYPFDGWQVLEMDALIAMKEFDEAFGVYNDTARIYSEELGLPPGQELLERLRTMERQMLHPVGSFSEIRKALGNENCDGPFYCYYPSFIDSCQILARMAERSGLSIYLLLCTLTDRNGKVFTDREKLEAQMEHLKNVISQTFRKGDLFTRYSKSQFLVILNGTEMENSILAFDRLLTKWKARDGASGQISYSMESLLNLVGIEIKNTREIVSWGNMEKKWRN